MYYLVTLITMEKLVNSNNEAASVLATRFSKSQVAVTPSDVTDVCFSVEISVHFWCS